MTRLPVLGYVLFVECHNIDTAHHGNLAGYALEELYQLDKAILAAHKMTSLDNTLTIVTADHSHAFTLNGYSARGTDILGAFTASFLKPSGFCSYRWSNSVLKKFVKL